MAESRGVRVDFELLLGRVLLQAAYSGRAADGSWRYGPPGRDADGARSFAVPEAALRDLDNYTAFYRFIPGYARAARRFEDAESGNLLALITAHRILGPERVRLNIAREDYRRGMDALAPLEVKKHTYDGGYRDMRLDLYDLSSTEYGRLSVHTTRSALLAHFFLRQYEFRRDDAVVAIEPGDTVIDGGMCFGDTALQFAFMAGPGGRVVGFEFEENNLAVLAENFRLNPELASSVTVVRRALAETSGRQLTFAAQGPATVRMDDAAAIPSGMAVRVETMSVDDMVRKEGLRKVDFVKLDVEGSELSTLIGAERTLKKHRPKLAISAYHKADDCDNFIRYLDSLDLGYRYWLDHFRPHAEETVLFAKAADA